MYDFEVYHSLILYHFLLSFLSTIITRISILQTTPFDMCVLNKIDRFTIVRDTIDYVDTLRSRGAHLTQKMRDLLVLHKDYIHTHGDDMPSVRDWKWNSVV